jgi:FtsZ-binding cell division protein ZapB
MGTYTTASGNTSTAMGSYVSTNSDAGSFIIGDNSATTFLNNSAANQMMMRFAGGYVLDLGTGGGVGMAINGTAAVSAPSAILDLASTTQGMLAPRMSATQMNAIASPATGLLVYNTTAPGLYNYTGSAWAAVGGGGSVTLTTTGASGAATLSGSALNIPDYAFNDTLTQNLYTNGYLLSGDPAGTSATASTGIRMGSNGLLVDSATFGNGTTLTTNGAGTRMIWYPKKAAFRAGYVDATEWDDANIGNFSTAMGGGTTASGAISTAMGYVTSANGNFSTAMGSYVLTNGVGSFIIGDNSTTTVLNNSAANQMMMRFAGGYTLYSNTSATTGVSLAAGGGSWASVSDRRKKANFEVMDKENMLQKVCAMPVTRWNYKSQPESQKHMGPMAQDFYAAFQLDGVGNDTTINTVDIDGVNMIAIQALAKRTDDLKAENDALKKENEKMAAENKKLSAENEIMMRQMKGFTDRMEKMEASLNTVMKEDKMSVK